MRYLSVCSGVEAASVAWHPLGWKPVAFSEIEGFPSAVLKHHYPETPNLGDLTKIDGKSLKGKIDLIVGGTPCQSFSLAGLRKGLEDPRGNLSLAFLRLVDQAQPKYFIWENVPGVLSSSKGQDFASFIGAVAEIGYRGAWRVLDAQYFGLAQRRKRVFFVGCSSESGVNPGEILFDSQSLRGDSTPVSTKGCATAGGLQKSLRKSGTDSRLGQLPLVLKIRGGKPGGGKGPLINQDQWFTLATSQDQTLLDAQSRVRRITPIESERLQGFPDNYTQISWKGKPAELCPDGPRYKAMGNSMAVPVMRWIGEQIDRADKYQREVEYLNQRYERNLAQMREDEVEILNYQRVARNAAQIQEDLENEYRAFGDC